MIKDDSSQSSFKNPDFSQDTDFEPDQEEMV